MEESSEAGKDVWERIINRPIDDVFYGFTQKERLIGESLLSHYRDPREERD